MPKSRDGKVLEVTWHKDARPPVYLVLGHVESTVALRNIVEHYGKSSNELGIPLSEGVHRYARWVQPNRLLKNEGVPRQIHLQDARGRGLFPVTVFVTKEAKVGNEKGLEAR